MTQTYNIDGSFVPSTGMYSHEKGYRRALLRGDPLICLLTNEGAFESHGPLKKLGRLLRKKGGER